MAMMMIRKNMQILLGLFLAGLAIWKTSLQPGQVPILRIAYQAAAADKNIALLDEKKIPA